MNELTKNINQFHENLYCIGGCKVLNAFSHLSKCKQQFFVINKKKMIYQHLTIISFSVSQTVDVIHWIETVLPQIQVEKLNKIKEIEIKLKK